MAERFNGISEILSGTKRRIEAAIKNDAFLDIIKDITSADANTVAVPITQERRTRKSNPRPDYWKSEWGRLLNNEKLYAYRSKAWMKFQRRFRFPPPLFDKLHHEVWEQKIFSSAHNSIPSEIKLLVCLRMLGKNYYTL